MSSEDIVNVIIPIPIHYRHYRFFKSDPKYTEPAYCIIEAESYDTALKIAKAVEDITYVYMDCGIYTIVNNGDYDKQLIDNITENRQKLEKAIQLDTVIDQYFQLSNFDTQSNEFATIQQHKNSVNINIYNLKAELHDDQSKIQYKNTIEDKKLESSTIVDVKKQSVEINENVQHDDTINTSDNVVEEANVNDQLAK